MVSAPFFCRDFPQTDADAQSPKGLAFYSWYQGFLTSTNFSRNSSRLSAINYQADTARIDEDMAFLRVYCLDNPGKQFIEAALALIRMHRIRLGLSR